MGGAAQGDLEGPVGRDELERLGGAEARAVDAAVHAQRLDRPRVLQRQRHFRALREVALHAQHAVRGARHQRALPARLQAERLKGYEVTVAFRYSMMLMRISLRR